MSAQTIYEQLRKAGCTPTGAISLMGNWQCEANLESCRVQGDFQSDRRKSKDYASSIDNGLVSDEQWCRDGKGWGLSQWTYWSRKEALLKFCRKRSISVANETAQVDFAIQELKLDYKAIWNDLTTCGEEDLYKMVELICKEYERPAFNNVQCRANAAVELKKQLQTVEAPKQDEDGADVYWPPRMLCIGMDGPDVTLLQALLLCHGYNCGGCTGEFNNRTRNMVLAYQAENGLDIDGVAGPKTFRTLGVTA